MKKFIKHLQENGIPVFFVRDITGKPSVTLTLVVVSGAFVAFGLLNRIANIVQGVDIQSALYWHGMSLGAYLGRKFSKYDGIEEKKD